MYRLIWNDGITETTNYFHTYEALKDWVWDKAGPYYLKYAFAIDQLIDGEYQELPVALGLRDE